MDDPREYELLRTISNYDDTGLVDAVIPRTESHDPLTLPELFDGTELPVRVLFKLLAANYLTTKLNQCGRWLAANPTEVYLPEEAPDEWDSEATVECIDGCLDDTLRARYLDGTTPTEASAQTD